MQGQDRNRPHSIVRRYISAHKDIGASGWQARAFPRPILANGAINPRGDWRLGTILAGAGDTHWLDSAAIPLP